MTIRSMVERHPTLERRRRGAASLLCACALTVAGIGALDAARDAQVSAQRSNESTCRDYDHETGELLSARAISPTSILLCETASVSATLRASCDSVPLHVVLNTDRSGSMVGQPIQDVKKAGKALVDILDLGENPSTKVGLVSHGDPPSRDLRLTNSEGQVIGRLNRLSAGGEDNLPRSIDESVLLLRQGRDNRDVTPVEAMVILSDGGQTYPPQQAIGSAGRAKGQGILVVSVCIDNGFGDCGTMRQLATSPRFYFETRSTAALQRIFREIAEDLNDINLRNVTVEETVPEGVELIDGSIYPEPEQIDGRTLKWRYRFVAAKEITYSYRVSPTRAGAAVFADTEIEYRDSRNAIGAMRVPTETLHIPGPCAGPSPTTTPTPTPTPTPVVPPSPTPTPTPTLTPSPTPSPTPETRLIYLPILNLYRCPVRERPVDAVLVIDASTSMRQPTSAGRAKIEAARDGALAWLEVTRPADRTAIIAFNSEATLAAGLTDDLGLLRSAVAGIETSPMTRIDLALIAATAELSGPRRRQEARGVIVLMTDGAPTGTTPESVRAAGGPARAVATVFTIGVGPAVDAALMSELAGAAERYFSVPEAEALATIYEEIREALPCPPR